MMTAFFFCFKDQSELGKGHMKGITGEVSVYLSHTVQHIQLKVKGIYHP